MAGVPRVWGRYQTRARNVYFHEEQSRVRESPRRFALTWSHNGLYAAAVEAGISVMFENFVEIYENLKLPLYLLVAFSIVGIAQNSSAGEPELSEHTLPVPFVFSLGGLNEKEIESLKSVPGVQEVSIEKGRAKVTYQPFEEKNWSKFGPGWITGAEKIYDFIALKKLIGKTRWTHGGSIGGRSGAITSDGPVLSGVKGIDVTFGMMFDDLTSGHNEIMAVRCFSGAEKAKVEHEMLSGYVGQDYSIEKCGPGYVIVFRNRGLVNVVWQVSDQLFVELNKSFDKDMVAAYVERLGSVTPKDYKISLDGWVEDEIRWRLMQLDHDYTLGGKS